MNKFMMLGRAQFVEQKVDVHAVAQFRCDFAKAWKKLTELVSR